MALVVLGLVVVLVSGSCSPLLTWLLQQEEVTTERAWIPLLSFKLGVQIRMVDIGFLDLTLLRLRSG